MTLITFDKNRYLTGIHYSSYLANLEGGIEIEDLPLELLNDIQCNLNAYQYIDGQLKKDEAKILENQQATFLKQLRFQRKEECFPIINRGALWYDLLTPDQTAELKTWYQAWLDVTDTLIIPEKPLWLE